MKDSSGSIPADRNSCNMNSNINLTLENIIYVNYNMAPDTKESEGGIREPDTLVMNGNYCEPDNREEEEDDVCLRDIAAEEASPYLSGSSGNAGKENEVNYPFGKELKRRNTRRAKFKDYRSPGFYMITVNAQKKTTLFCWIYAFDF